jgi:hypothetical protein
MAAPFPDCNFFQNAIKRLTASPCDIYWVLLSNERCITATALMMKNIRKKHRSTKAVVSMSTDTEILFRNGSRFRCKVQDIYRFNTHSRICVTLSWEDYQDAMKHEDELIETRQRLAQAECQLERLQIELEVANSRGLSKAEEHCERVSESLDEDSKVY